MHVTGDVTVVRLASLSTADVASTFNFSRYVQLQLDFCLSELLAQPGKGSINQL